jgi:hypothetical protein
MTHVLMWHGSYLVVTVKSKDVLVTSFQFLGKTKFDKELPLAVPYSRYPLKKEKVRSWN